MRDAFVSSFEGAEGDDVGEVEGDRSETSCTLVKESASGGLSCSADLLIEHGPQ